MTPWTADDVDQLRSLWSRGYSATIIGDDLGVTRNAVMGKVTRLRLEKRETLYKAERITQIHERAPRKRSPRKSTYTPPRRIEPSKVDLREMLRQAVLNTGGV